MKSNLIETLTESGITLSAEGQTKIKQLFEAAVEDRASELSAEQVTSLGALVEAHKADLTEKTKTVLRTAINEWQEGQAASLNEAETAKDAEIAQLKQALRESVELNEELLANAPQESHSDVVLSEAEAALPEEQKEKIIALLESSPDMEYDVAVQTVLDEVAAEADDKEATGKEDKEKADAEKAKADEDKSKAEKEAGEKETKKPMSLQEQTIALMTRNKKRQA